MPAVTAASKSTSQRMPASTGMPSGNPPASDGPAGDRDSASPAVTGEPVTLVVVPPPSSTTVQAGGSSAAVAGESQLLPLTGGLGGCGGGTGSLPGGVGATGRWPMLTGVAWRTIHAARGAP